MDVREIRDPAGWDSWAHDWKHIAEACPTATCFQTWEWVRPWWDHFGGDRQLWVLAFRDGGQTVGFVPLYRPPVRLPMRVLRLIGTGVSDYLDGIALPGYEAKVMSTFWSFLSQRRGRWDCLDLQELAPDSLLASHWPSTGRLRANTLPANTCPRMALPTRWFNFLEGLTKRVRSDHQRRVRKMYREYESVQVALSSPDRLDEDMSALFALHRLRWKHRWRPGKFSSAATRAFHLAVARRQLACDRLRLHTLRLKGMICGAIYCFQFKGTCSYYLSGFDPAFASLAPGNMITALAIEHAIETDRAQMFDFLRGTEAYKYAWGAEDRHNLRMSVTRPGLRPLFVAAAGRAADQTRAAAYSCLERLLPVSRQRS